MKTILPILILASCSTSPRVLTEPSRESGGVHDTVGAGVGVVFLDEDTKEQSDEADAGPIHKIGARDTSEAIANFVSVRRVGDEFVYNDGRRRRVVPVTPDRLTSERLGFALQKGRDRDSMMMRMRVACTGGFEVCLNDTAYLYYEETDKQGHCSGSWYATETFCK
jgi:hypothetical protein